MRRVCLILTDCAMTRDSRRCRSERLFYGAIDSGVIIKIGRKEGRKERIFFGSWRAYSTSRSYLPHTSSTLNIPDTGTRACASCACVRHSAAHARARAAPRSRVHGRCTRPARHCESRAQRISHGGHRTDIQACATLRASPRTPISTRTRTHGGDGQVTDSVGCACVRASSAAACVQACAIADQSLLPLPPLLLSKLLLLLLVVVLLLLLLQRCRRLRKYHPRAQPSRLIPRGQHDKPMLPRSPTEPTRRSRSHKVAELVACPPTSLSIGTNAYVCCRTARRIWR